MLLINDEVKDYSEHIVLTSMTDAESLGRSADSRDPTDLPRLHWGSWAAVRQQHKRQKG